MPTLHIGLAYWPAALGVTLENEKDLPLKISSSLQFAAGNAGRWWWAARLVTRCEQVDH